MNELQTAPTLHMTSSYRTSFSSTYQTIGTIRMNTNPHFNKKNPHGNCGFLYTLGLFHSACYYCGVPWEGEYLDKGKNAMMLYSTLIR